MEMLKKLSLNAQLVLLGTIVYVIDSFLSWQSYNFSIGTYSRTEWNGIGVVAGLLVLLLLAWELGRAFDLKVAIGSLSPSVVSVVLAELLLVFTVIKFLSSSARAYGAWVGLVVAIVIGVVGYLRGKEEGAQMPSGAKTGNPGATA
jgi:hypothetical protein